MKFEESTPSTKMEHQGKILRVSHILSTLEEVESGTTAPFYSLPYIHYSFLTNGYPKAPWSQTALESILAKTIGL